MSRLTWTGGIALAARISRVGGVCMCMLAAGCASVEVSREQRAKLAELGRAGVTWRGEVEKKALQPTVKTPPAVLWSLLPGAGQHFVAHKMLDAGFYDGDYADMRASLQRKGTLMVAVSWLPFIYPFTLTWGMAGTVADVNRANNLALLESRQKTKATKPKAEPRTPGAAVAARPRAAVAPPLTPGQREALGELESLRAAGLCSDAEYARRRAAILKAK